MSLNHDDLQAIRKIVEETVHPISGELEALRNDIKEIYDMIAALNKDTDTQKSDKLSVEQKLLQIQSDLIRAAKQAGVELPTH